MEQTKVLNQSNVYSIFAEGLKQPTEEWVYWYNKYGKRVLTTKFKKVMSSQDLTINLPETLHLEDLSRLYIDSFIISGPYRLVPVESLYKKWTEEKSNLSFASSSGYLMGDSAVHMNFIFKKLYITIPEQFQLMPDHLILQLELLALLEEASNIDFLNEFIFEHLDWTHLLLEECAKKNWSGFYYEWFKLIHLFFKNRCWE